MAPRDLIGSLGFQMTAAILGLALLFGAAGLYTLGAFQRQLAYDSVVTIAGRLELAAEQMHTQGMNYKQNAPRDYATYDRDLRLYYQDLMAQVATFDRVVDTFMQGDFRGEMAGLLPWIRPRVGAEVTAAIRELEAVWGAYRADLFQSIGEDLDEPRLEWAAEHIIARHEPLRLATYRLSDALGEWTRTEHRRLTQGALALAVAAALVAAGLLITLRFNVLAPLKQTTQGFERVAEGDFRHQVPEGGTSEVQGLTRSFNQLSVRLDLLHRLIEGLQRGKDLDELLGFLSRDFRTLLGFDWIGAVFADARRSAARIDDSWLDGERQGPQPQLFRLQGTLLADALGTDAPLHVPDAAARVGENPGYEFLAHLVSLGMREALFLPLTPRSQSPIPAVVVFAARDPERMDTSQRGLLGNIAELLTQAFGRTARFAEQSRLAAIGEFASGIAHEVRTPLSTISMALDYLAERPLEERARKRVELGIQEAGRIRRLLEDILLYAKPLGLDLAPADLVANLHDLIAEDQARQPGLRLRLAADLERAPVLLDGERFRQVFTNLTENARQADPDGAEILWRVLPGEDDRRVQVSVHNGGEPIPAELLPRLTDPFVSRRPGGTGLGLAIVRRLVEQHGGEIAITSSREAGTEVRLVFPRLSA